MERKRILQDIVIENDRIAISRFIEQKGIEFYRLAEINDLEGIVAKKKESKYYFDTRTKDWIKIKNLLDEDFVVCGYIEKDNNVASIILGQYREDELVYKGHVTLGVSNNDFSIISKTRKIDKPYFKNYPSGNENAIWIDLFLVCTVKYMMKTASRDHASTGF
jgi:bifunctional non-homologous end joining protein LigD/DNA ligase-1